MIHPSIMAARLYPEAVGTRKEIDSLSIPCTLIVEIELFAYLFTCSLCFIKLLQYCILDKIHNLRALIQHLF